MTVSQATVLVVAAAVAVMVWIAERCHPTLRRRRRLGVDTSAHLARPGDLRSLVVRRRGLPTARFVLGRVRGATGRHLIATANTRTRGRRNRPTQGRSSVAIIGPTRCGKTATTISGVLDWDGPAILSSVKTDLMGATYRWRTRCGDVRVFDPTRSTGTASAAWSPLRGADTITGAQHSARALLDAGPRTGAENLDFFLRLAEQLLWPHLYLAAASGSTMIDVVRWIHAQTSPADPDTDLGALTLVVEDTDGAAAAETLLGTYALDRRTRASAYATAQTLLGPWTDPTIADTPSAADIDLEWLLAGSNTLYICAPLHHQQRLAPLFGGLLGDLINQAYERVNRTNTPLPPTLLVLDEAANTPTAWLPQVASTCAGIGIQLVTVWQSKAQLDAAYGRLGDSVLTNHATKLFFPGISDLPTLDYVSRLIGDEQVERRTASRDWARPSRAESIGPHDTPLVAPHVLRQAQGGRALLVHGTLPPARIHARPYFRDRRLRARTDQP